MSKQYSIALWCILDKKADARNVPLGLCHLVISLRAQCRISDNSNEMGVFAMLPRKETCESDI